MDKTQEALQKYIAKIESNFEKNQLANAAYFVARNATNYLISKYINQDNISYVKLDIENFIRRDIESNYGVRGE